MNCMASGAALKAQLVKQSYIEQRKARHLFPKIRDINLSEVFRPRPRYEHRTSSAIWDSPIGGATMNESSILEVLMGQS